jgi:hypothetical protein
MMRQKSTIVKQIRKTAADIDIGWDAMIRDAKKRIEDLNFAIKVFERRKEAGEPWPGAQASNQTAESCHSV